MTPPTPVRSSRGRRTLRATGDDRERDILATFERLLEERPLHEISVDDLARGAGISRPTFYFYFASKEAVLLSMVDRLIADARAARGDVVARFAEDPPARLREAIRPFYESCRAHRAVTVATADASVTSTEIRELWSRIMEDFVREATAVIEAERARGAAPDGVPARDLATCLLWMNDKVLQTALAGRAPAVAEDDVLDVLVAIWLNAIYGTTTPPSA